MPSVDNRVVEMRFDNKQFESGVGTSLTSLEKLKKSLKLEDAAKGFSTIDKAANNVDVSGLNAAVQSINDRFSSLGIIGNQVLRRIGDEVFNLERKMLGLVKSMSVDQITKGFGKYEEKTGSVQTIMNATGKSIGGINKYLDRLMWYSDETSFGFTDMTTALQTMTSSGGELDNLIPMLMGIGNAVAFAGKGASEFSRVMYNLNQSYSMGYLSTQDWKSVELMGASSKQLKEQLISVAEELGNIKKGAYGLEDFSELLTKKVFDKKVMEKAFGNFADMTLKAEELVKNGTFDTASEAYDYLASKYDTVSLKAAKAAQEAKTFSEAIDATKDAVSSGWMKTFELLIGDYQEAKTLWTKLANDLWDMFASGAESRNAILTTWHNFGYGMTGYEALMESLSNIWEGFSNIVYAVKDALSEVIPPITSKRLTDLTFKFKELTENFKKTFHIAEDMGAVWREVWAPYKQNLPAAETLSEETARNAKNVDKLTESNEGLKESEEELHKVNSRISAENLMAMRQEIKERTTTSDGILTIQKIVRGIGSGLSLIAQAGSAVWNQVIKPAGRVVVELLSPVVDILAWIGEKITNLNNGLKKTGLFEKVLKPIGDVLRWVGDRLHDFNTKLKETNFFGRNLEKIVGIFRRFKERLKEIWEQAKNLQSVKDLIDRFTKFKESLDGGKFSFIDKINGFFDKLDAGNIPLPSLEKCLSIIDSIAGGINKFIGYIEEGWPKVKEFFGSFDFSKTEEGASSAYEKVKTFIKNIFEDNSVIDSSKTFFSNVFSGLETALSNIDWGKMLLTIFGGLSGAGIISILFGVGKTTRGVGNITGSVAEAIKNVSGTIGKIKKAIGAYANDKNADAVLKLAIAIGILAAALIALTFVDSEKLTQAAADLAMLVLVFTGLTKALAIFKRGNNIDTVNGVFTNAGTINLNIPKFAANATALGLALLGLAAAVYVMSSIKADELTRVLKQLGIAAGVMTAIVITFMALSKKLGDDSAKSANKLGGTMMKIASAMLILSAAVFVLSSIPNDKGQFDNAMKWAAILIGVMGIVAIIGEAVSKKGDPKAITKLGIAFILFAAALLIITPALVALSIVAPQLLKTAGALAIIMVAFAALVGVLGSLSKKGVDLKEIQKSVLALSGALIIMAGAMYILGNIPDLSTMGLGLLAVVASLLALVGVAYLVSNLGLSTALYSVAAAITSIGLSVALVGFGALAFAKAMQLLSDSSVNAKEAGQNLAEGIVAFFDTIMEKGQSILQFVGLLIGAIILAIAAHKAKLVETAISMITSLIEAIPTTGPALFSAAGLLLAGLLEWLGVQVGPIVESLIALLLITLNSFAIAIVKYGTQIGKAIGNIVKALGGFLLEAIAGFLDPVMSFIFGSEWRESMDWLNAASNEVISDIEEDNEQLRSMLSESASSIREGGEEIQNAAEDTSEKVGNTDLLSGLTGSIDMQKLGLGESLSEVSSTLTSGSQDITTAVDGVSQSLNSVDLGSGIDLSAFPESVQTAMDDGTGVVETSGQEFLDALTALKDEGNITGQEFGESLVTGVDQGIFSMEDLLKSDAALVMTNTTDAMAEAAGINSPSTVTTEQGKNIDIGLAQGMSNNVTFVTVASRRVMNSAVDALKPLYGKFRQAGKDSVTGLVNGLSDYMYKVSEKAKVMGNTLLTVFGRTIQWGSPAKKFIQAGKDVNRGLAIGLDNYQYFSTNAAKRLGNSTIDKVRSILKDLATVIDQDVDVNPRITPVLDLSELQNGGNRISSLLSGRGIGYTPSLAYARAAGAAINVGSADIRTGSDSGVINAIREIRNDISELNDSITKMKLYIDKGALVGAMLPDIDSGLNTRIGYKRRGL